MRAAVGLAAGNSGSVDLDSLTTRSEREEARLLETHRDRDAFDDDDGNGGEGRDGSVVGRLV